MNKYDSGFFEMIESSSRSGFYRAFGKRIFDIVLTLLVLPIALPIVIILACLIAIYGGSPFHRQYRVGRKGRLYQMWMLRPTEKDADGGFEYRRGCEAVGERKFIENSRLGKLDRFLRQSSFDQLPLLLNVLIGDMSLVGPQPMTVSQMAFYPGSGCGDLRPGLTGLWQISPRPHTSRGEHVACDARYNQSLSFTSDLAILATTMKVAMRRS